MTIDSNQFWRLLTESGLIPAVPLQALFSDFSEDPAKSRSAQELARWLVQEKMISEYQAKVLLGGQSGPFRFGGYTVFDRLDSGSHCQVFLGRHTATSFPVLLHFFPGSVPADLAVWDQIESIVDILAPIEHPNLTETFEAVVLPNHRFVATQFLQGSTLAEKLPSKGRLSWQQACELIAHTTQGLSVVHNAGLLHQSLSLDKIWLEKNGTTQLKFSPFDAALRDRTDPESVLAASKAGGAESHFDFLAPEAYGPNPQFSPASDLYSIGCILFRIISGRPPFPESDLQKKQELHRFQIPSALTKYNLPADLMSLVEKLMAKDPQDRPQSAAEVSTLLGRFSGKSEKIKSVTIPVSPSRLAYLKSLAQFRPLSSDQDISTFPDLTESESRPDSIHQAPASQASWAPGETTEHFKSASLKARRRRKNLWFAPTVGGAILFLIVAFFAIRELWNTPGTTSRPSEEKHLEAPITDSTDSNQSTDSSPEPTLTVIQQLIEDDGHSLWETPTTGPPIEFSFIPATPKLLFVFRVADLLETSEGQRLLKSMGARFQSDVNEFVARSGLELVDIEQLIVSMHSNDDFEYDPFYIIRANRPIATDHLIQKWNRPTMRGLDNGQELFESRDGTTAYYVLHRASDPTRDPQSDSTHADQISLFAFGKPKIVEDVALNARGTALAGSLRKIANWTDRDRHLNFLFLRNSLFNDEGQHWMGDGLQSFNRELNVLFPDGIRGGLVSFHIDDGNYLEIILDRNVELKPDDLARSMNNELREQRDRLTQFVTTIPSSAYWDKVRLRYDNMLSDLFRNLRWSVEQGEVVANCWLPPIAAHNLLAASELVLSFSSGSSATQAAPETGPSTLEELLATKRDLNIANPPDLNVLLSDLQNEINDDFRNLPFPFRIRLLGSDLQKEGITKNQRPNELVIEQKTLAQILTSIMTSANPSKDITGPDDPNCKLIWVIAEDPENPTEKAVLITTRAAAAEKSYELPPAFRTE